MKVRYGHVSNSSTSSFIVERFDYIHSELNKSLLSIEQEKLLKRLGFKPTWVSNPDQIETFAWDFPIAEDGAWFACHHLINHDEIFAPLIKAKIPFHAVHHYGQWDVFWDGKSDTILNVKNVGNTLCCMTSNEDRRQEALEALQDVIVLEPITAYVKE
jgi:hypothetical protein